MFAVKMWVLWKSLWLAVVFGFTVSSAEASENIIPSSSNCTFADLPAIVPAEWDEVQVVLSIL